MQIIQNHVFLTRIWNYTCYLFFVSGGCRGRKNILKEFTSASHSLKKIRAELLKIIRTDLWEVHVDSHVFAIDVFCFCFRLGRGMHDALCTLRNLLMSWSSRKLSFFVGREGITFMRYLGWGWKFPIASRWYGMVINPTVGFYILITSHYRDSLLKVGWPSQHKEFRPWHINQYSILGPPILRHGKEIIQWHCVEVFV